MNETGNMNIDPRDRVPSDQLDALSRVFSEQLLACLDECARGRTGLFSELIDEEEKNSWPEAARLRELAVALQNILAQHEERNALATSSLTCARFTARAILGSANWRVRFWRGLSAARWVRRQKKKGRGDSGSRTCRGSWTGLPPIFCQAPAVCHSLSFIY